MGFERNLKALSQSDTFEIIMKSGLLLDEDLEILIANHLEYKVDTVPFRQSLAKVLLSIVPALSTVLFIQRKIHMIYPTLAIIPSAGMLIEKTVCRVQKWRRRERVKHVVNTLKQFCRINVRILRYVKQQNGATSFSEDPHNGRHIRLLKTTLREEIKVISLLIEVIQHLVEYSNLTSVDYGYLKRLDLSKYSSVDGNVEDCIEGLQTLNDIFILVISHFLTTLACSLKVTDDSKIHNRVRAIENASKHSFYIVDRTFRNVQFSCFTKEDLKIPTPNVGKIASEKLKADMFHTLAQLNHVIILSKSTFHKLEDNYDQENMLKCVSKLRDSVSDYHESLNNFLASFEKYSAKTSPSQTLQVPSQSLPSETVISEPYLFQEPEDDEEFEFNAEDDLDALQYCLALNESMDDDGSEVQIYAPGLYQELKKHDKFVAASKRFKVNHNLPPVQVDSPVEAKTEEILSVLSCPVLPPPPPPPLPKISTDSENTVENQQNSSLLMSLAAFTKHRNQKEEVFQADT